jgi:hypothetical protein
LFFLENYAAFSYAVSASVDVFKKYDLEGMIKKSAELKTICLCSMKEDDVLAGNGEIFFNNFERAGVAPQIFDLVGAAERRGKASGKFSLAEIAAVYRDAAGENVEIELLETILNYPSKYLKLFIEYYEKKRSWAPNRFYQKIDELKN